MLSLPPRDSAPDVADQRPPGMAGLTGPLKRHDSTSSSGNSPNDVNVPDHLNIPRRRDSGNWSGDRNSASSSSSTSMENPYLYLVGKMRPHGPGQLGVPRSPTSIKPGDLSSSSSGCGSGGPCDPGYDSYSLSSTDSLPLQLGLRHNLQVRHRHVDL